MNAIDKLLKFLSVLFYLAICVAVMGAYVGVLPV